MEREILRVCKLVAIMSLVMGSAFFAIGMGRGLGFQYSFVNAFILVIVANVPEGLPATVASMLNLTAVELAPSGAAGEAKLALVRTGATTAIAVEAREAAGYDAALPQPGALVYAMDTSLATGNGALRVQRGRQLAQGLRGLGHPLQDFCLSRGQLSGLYAGPGTKGQEHEAPVHGTAAVHICQIGLQHGQ